MWQQHFSSVVYIVCYSTLFSLHLQYSQTGVKYDNGSIGSSARQGYTHSVAQWFIHLLDKVIHIAWHSGSFICQTRLYTQRGTVVHSSARQGYTHSVAQWFIHLLDMVIHIAWQSGSFICQTRLYTQHGTVVH